jgi:1-aminocyclopropane-1-carboxylate deaminase/D-cysteine desulfhydrase-like pyridoxal-dependent ACC family enzyme
VLTFGGAYSNHIFATASAANLEGFESIGIIRGEDLDPENPTLAHAKEKGMQLMFTSREDYRKKASEGYLQRLKTIFGDFYLIPEGGTNPLAMKGTAEILEETCDEYTHIGTAIGTGGTFAGLAKSIKSHQTLLGFSSLKGEFIQKEIEQLLEETGVNQRVNFEIFTSFHFGGYAKWNSELIDFIHRFWEEFGIPLDPIYTGKMAYGFWQLLEKNYFPPHSKLLLIHTGGLQGNAGFTQRTGVPLPTL